MRQRGITAEDIAHVRRRYDTETPAQTKGFMVRTGRGPNGRMISVMARLTPHVFHVKTVWEVVVKMRRTMKVSYGEDVAYVELGQGKVARTAEVAPGVLLDLDERGQAVGLEIVGLESRGLAQGVVEVEMATAAVGDEELRLAEEMFGDQDDRAQTH
jgi:uncharacterized protein YuzE